MFGSAAIGGGVMARTLGRRGIGHAGRTAIPTGRLAHGRAIITVGAGVTAIGVSATNKPGSVLPARHGLPAGRAGSFFHERGRLRSTAMSHFYNHALEMPVDIASPSMPWVAASVSRSVARDKSEYQWFQKLANRVILTTNNINNPSRCLLHTPQAG